ncbi:Maf family nucleotide pyrophosphatase [Psychroflexus aestuariivivens]|uniref:Maf family nucleotide pyrophosphatase n=1 Tax=Psychroflexus aestuariivivens TaxID=1795040 RepID=UPI000FDB93A4|nr:Maf family nucleotide pyrophosphatase [Psychroflexus aestuariivivens]
MIIENINQKNIILASGSPRRQEILKAIGVNFKVKLRSVDEDFSNDLKHAEISNFLAKLKADQFQDLKANDLLITGDTIVWHQNQALNKPSDENHAFEMLSSLSDATHEVISSVCIKTLDKEKVIYDVTKVKFRKLSADEIWFYINNYKPFDKAGAYGIQEWIGKIGISEMQGSFYNVMGLPIDKLYLSLEEFVD